MRLRKVISILIVLALCMSALIGCGGSKETADNTPGEKKEVKTESNVDKKDKEETAVEEPIEIEWLAYNCYAQPDPDSKIIKKMEQDFNAKFNFWFVDDQRWDEVLGVKLASGDMPDVMRVKNTANIANYVKQGILAEITDDMKAKMPTFMANVASMAPEGDMSGFIDTIYNGKQYALKLPSITGSFPTVLVWRTDWLKQYGIDKIPTTLEEFETAMYKFANEDPDGNGKKDTYGFSNTTMNAVFGAFGPIPLKEYRGTGTQNLFYVLKDGKVDFACIQPEMKDALATLQKWYRDGIIDPEFVTGENKGGYWAVSQDFENGKVGVTGMCMATHWQPPNDEGKLGPVYKSYMNVNPDAKWKDTFYIGTGFEGPEGKAGTHAWGAFGSSGFAITTQGAEEPRKLDTILNIIETNSSNFDTFIWNRFGVEDEHYVINDKGIYEAIDPYKEVVEGGKVGRHVLSTGFNLEFDKKADYSAFAFLEEFKGAGYTDVLVPPTQAADMYLTDLKTFTLDAYMRIITGEQDVDYFDTFVEEFKELGGQQILDEINAN